MGTALSSVALGSPRWRPSVISTGMGGGISSLLEESRSSFSVRPRWKIDIDYTNLRPGWYSKNRSVSLNRAQTGRQHHSSAVVPFGLAEGLIVPAANGAKADGAIFHTNRKNK